MFDLNKAPERGTLYAVFVEEIVYEKYSSKEEVKERLGHGELLELHMFDKNQEYRYLKTQSGGEIERVISDQTVSYEDIYEEKIYVEDTYAQKAGKKVGVVNYIQYDENDLLLINDYRLKEVE